MLTSDDHVIVVGAGLAGWRLVEALRAEGYAGKISLVGAEESAPYDRPPLSKQVLAGKPSAFRDIVILNSAAALMVAGKATNLKQGAELAVASIDGGKAAAALATLQRLCA